MEDFKQKLRLRLSQELPAYEAHQKMMKHRKPLHQIPEVEETAKKSAVLALLYPRESKLHTVFILRPSYKGVHSGQISFPGGKMELSDQNLEMTALREAEEELNIQQNEVEVLGSLSPLYVPPSNFLIHPYLAFQNSIPSFIPEKREVEKEIECPIHLLEEDNMIDAEVNVLDGRLKVKGFQLENHLLWGATAMIVKEMMEVIGDVRVGI